MGRPRPRLAYFTNGSGGNTTSDEKVEQVAEVRRRSRAYQTLSSACLRPQKLQFFRVRPFLKAVSWGKLSKCDKRFWRRRCFTDPRPKSSLLLQAFTFLFPWSTLVKRIKISKPHCTYFVRAFCDFEIPTLVFLYLISPECKWGPKSYSEDILRTIKTKYCGVLRNDCSENQ